MIALRPEHQIDRRHPPDDLLALGLRHAAGDADDEVLAQRAALVAHLAQAAELGKHLLRGLFADVAGVEHDEVGVADIVRRLIAVRRQRVRHTIGIVDVHLAAVGLDEELFHGGVIRCGWLNRDWSKGQAVARHLPV